MTTERIVVRVAVFLILKKGAEVLLLKRANTGHEDGNYGLVCGHLETGESALQAMVREAQEEAGIEIRPQDLQLVHTQHLSVVTESFVSHTNTNQQSPNDYLNLYFVASKWDGEIVNSEPEKCDGLEWFNSADMPKNVITYVRDALEKSEKGVSYSEWGW